MNCGRRALSACSESMCACSASWVDQYNCSAGLKLKWQYAVLTWKCLGSLAVNMACTFSVCVYVNKHGNSGPHLDKKKVQQLPDHFGPGPVNVVLQQAVQACVDCAYQAKTVFGFLKSGHHGGEMITGMWRCSISFVSLVVELEVGQKNWSSCSEFI